MRKTFWKMMFGHHIDLAHHKPIYENFEVTSEIKFGIDLFENILEISNLEYFWPMVKCKIFESYASYDFCGNAFDHI